MLRKLIMSCQRSLRPRADSVGRLASQPRRRPGSVRKHGRTAAQRSLALIVLLGFAAAGWADEPSVPGSMPAEASVPAKPPRNPNRAPASTAASGSAVTEQQAAQLIAALGAATFAERERAMVEIMRIGGALAPYLRDAIQTEQDPELLLRAQKTLQYLTEDSLEAQIETFLSADPDAVGRGREWFEGWVEVEELLGDSLAVRELFIEVMKSHPHVTTSLAGTTAQRTAAAERAVTLVQTGMMERRQLPTLADAAAMLLPLTDPAVQVGAGYEATLLSVFNRQFATVRRDAQLWPPVSKLLQEWLPRSRIENRADVLWYAMQWDLPASKDLGLQTLQETTDVEMLQTALQAISRFGTAADAPQLVNLLADERPAVVRMPVMVDNQPLKVAVADVALATIATLYQVPLKELQMPAGEIHPKVGIIVEHAGYTAAQAEQRAAAIERARRWCSGQPPQGQPRS